MRRLEMPIRTFELDRVKVALAALGVTRLHVTKAQGPTTDALGTVAFLPRIRVLVDVPDAVADQVGELLARAS